MYQKDLPSSSYCLIIQKLLITNLYLGIGSDFEVLKTLEKLVEYIIDCIKRFRQFLSEI